MGIKITVEVETREEAKEFLDGTTYKSVLKDLDNSLRKKIKYETLTKDQEEILKLIREELYTALNDYEVTID